MDRRSLESISLSLTVVSIQSQSIDSSYDISPASRTPGLMNKKAGYAPDLQGAYQPLLLAGYTLSQMTDTYTKHLVMASGAELKPAHGNIVVEAFGSISDIGSDLAFTKIG